MADRPAWDNPAVPQGWQPNWQSDWQPTWQPNWQTGLPTQQRPPENPPRGADPLAVAVGNASLLGVGYLLLRRWWIALGAVLVTVALLVLLIRVAPTVGLEWGLLAWWLVQIGHGALLAYRVRHRPQRVLGQRLAAVAVALPVLLVVTLLRFDAAGIEREVDTARATGDCARAEAALGDVWFGHRVVDAPLTTRTDRTALACSRLRAAGSELTVALTGEVPRLSKGYAGLAAVRRDLPGHERMVRAVLDEFLTRLRTDYDDCANAMLTDWLRRHSSQAPELNTADAVAESAPAGLLRCGDTLTRDGRFQRAQQRYRQLLAQYPNDGHVPQARKGLRRAVLAGELEHVRDLLEGPPGDYTPEYCGSPAKYEAAPPYHRGRTRALIYGNGQYSARFPGSWRAPDATRSALVMCLGNARNGDVVETCPYVSDSHAGGLEYVVTYHKVAVPVRAYELRTGRLVINRTVQISGASCPASLTTYGAGSTPPPDARVAPSGTQIREAFRPLFERG